MAGKKKKPFDKEQLRLLLMIASVLAAAVLLLVALPKVLNRMKGPADPSRQAPEVSSVEEEEVEVLNVHTQNGSPVEAVEHEDTVYIAWEAVNRYYLCEEYFLDLNEKKLFHTTLQEGKTSSPIDDLPLLVEGGNAYLPLDWAGETYGFSVERETEHTIITGPEAEYKEEPADLLSLETPIVVTWFQDFYGTYTEETSKWLSRAMEVSTVISPTWYSLQEDGTVTSLANAELVQEAHEKGLQVWPLFDNGFDDKRTMAILSQEKERDRLVQEMLDQCQTLGLDGINLDFELLGEETAPYFVEFVRELGAVLRPAGFYLSVDVHVPANWSWYYRRDLLGRASDYLIVMAYDEHYVGGEAGSTSSMPFLTKAVSDMLAVVPAEKLIVGIPFYTRLWYIEGEETTSEALSMTKTQDYIKEKKLKPTYDEATGQNYVSRTEGEVLEQIWIEDAESFGKRLDLIKEQSPAGIACWKAGMETEDIWTLIEAYRGGGKQ